jgi:chromosome segregation ATPase
MKSAMILIQEKKSFTYLDDKINTASLSIQELVARLTDLEERLFHLESIIEPDKQDVYNINRRLEILAQKIAMLESNTRGFWQRFG